MGNCPNNKVHGASMGPIWGRQDPGGPHVGPMNFVIWVCRGSDIHIHAEYATIWATGTDIWYPRFLNNGSQMV